MFPRMAFAEMGSADQAADIVKYFLHNPLKLRGKLLEFSLSAACSFVQNSCVVSFSSLPAGEGICSELTAIARRFGSVKHSLFLPGRGFVEMASTEEASKLVEHYSANSLRLKGKTIHVSFSAEYRTLGDKDADNEESPTSISRKRRRSLHPQRRSHSPRKNSPIPKRRTSAENSRSRRSSSRTRDERQRSEERSRESSRQDRSSRSNSRKSPLEDQSQQTEESAEQKTEDKKDQSDGVCDDSDLEGVAVIAEDCDELNSEDEEFIEVYHEDDQDSSAALTDQEMSEDMQNLEESDDNATLSNTDLTNMNSETSQSDPNITASDRSSECKRTRELLNNKTLEISDASSECKEAKELQQNQEAPKDTTVETSDASDDGKEAQEIHQNSEAQKDTSVEITDGSSECNEAKELQQNQEVQRDSIVSVEQEASYFPVNLENSVTMDEFTEEMTEQADKQDISTSSTKDKYGKVLEVKGFPLAKKYTEADLLNIGKKCGEVAGCCLVRNSRKVEKALIEMVKAADASRLETESKKQNFKLGGKILKITVSDKYTQVKERVSMESDSRKAGEEKHVEMTDEELLHSGTSCQEMPAGTESSEDEAQRKTSMLTIIQMSSNEEGTLRETDRDESKTQNDSDQLSSQISPNLGESSDDNEGVKLGSASDDGTETLIEKSASVSEPSTHLNDPVGTQFVRPVVGYFCSLCDVIYASEEEAKEEHCRTSLHHQRLKERVEQNSSAQSRNV